MIACASHSHRRPPAIQPSPNRVSEPPREGAVSTDSLLLFVAGETLRPFTFIQNAQTRYALRTAPTQSGVATEGFERRLSPDSFQPANNRARHWTQTFIFGHRLDTERASVGDTRDRASTSVPRLFLRPGICDSRLANCPSMFVRLSVQPLFEPHADEGLIWNRMPARLTLEGVDQIDGQSQVDRLRTPDRQRINDLRRGL